MRLILTLLMFILPPLAFADESFKDKVEKMISEKIGIPDLVVNLSNSYKNITIHDTESLDLFIDVDEKKFEIKVFEKAKNKKLITGKFDKAAYIPVPAVIIESGEEITPQMLESKRIAANEVTSKIISSTDDLVGKFAKKRLMPGKILHVTDVKAKPIVLKGTEVRIVFRKKNLSIESSGVAMEDGAMNDMIRIKNSESGKIVKATVIEANMVMVNATHK